MPSPIEIAKLLPIIIKLFPELVTSPVLRGKIIPLLNVNAETETELAKKLDRKTRIKKDKSFNDKTSVIKVSEALKCVEKKFNDTSLLVQFVLGAAKALTGDTGATAAQKLADQMAECIRENALRQDTPRVITTKRFYHRPARGHGQGRKSF